MGSVLEVLSGASVDVVLQHTHISGLRSRGREAAAANHERTQGTGWDGPALVESGRRAEPWGLRTPRRRAPGAARAAFGTGRREPGQQSDGRGRPGNRAGPAAARRWGPCGTGTRGPCRASGAAGWADAVTGGVLAGARAPPGPTAPAGRPRAPPPGSAAPRLSLFPRPKISRQSGGKSRERRPAGAAALAVFARDCPLPAPPPARPPSSPLPAGPPPPSPRGAPSPRGYYGPRRWTPQVQVSAGPAPRGSLPSPGVARPGPASSGRAPRGPRPPSPRPGPAQSPPPAAARGRSSAALAGVGGAARLAAAPVRGVGRCLLAGVPRAACGPRRPARAPPPSAAGPGQGWGAVKAGLGSPAPGAAALPLPTLPAPLSPALPAPLPCPSALPAAPLPLLPPASLPPCPSCLFLPTPLLPTPLLPCPPLPPPPA